jgi:hypothetical protein
MAKICDFIIDIDGKPTELTKDELIEHLSKVDKKTGESVFDSFVKEGAKVIDLSSIEQARLSGASARGLDMIAKRLGLPQIPKGEVLSPKEYKERGRLLLDNGVSPEQIESDFKQNGTVSADTVSVAEAYKADLMKAADDARKEFGMNSKEYKEAASKYQDWAANVVKPMGTEFSAVGRALQGFTDIDTGSFVSLAEAYKEKTGKEPNAAAVEQIEKLVKEVNDSKISVEQLQAKLTETIDKLAKAEEEIEKSREGIKEKAKKIASIIRKAKFSRPDMFSAATPETLVWDTAIEITAKTIEVSGDIAQAVKDGIEHIKQSEWYKNLDSEKRKQAEQQFKDFINNNTNDRAQQRIENLEKKLEEIKAQKGQEPKENKKQAERVKSQEELKLEREIEDAKFDNLVSRFEGKKDSKFTMVEARDIWNYAKNEYLDKGKSFEQMLSGTANDLGLTMKQVRDAITTPKGARVISDEMYRKINQRRTAMSRAENYVETADKTRMQKILGSIPNFFFGLKTFGHGTVGAFTHAGMNLFQPSKWKQFFPFFINQFKYSTSVSKYEQAMEDLKNHPDYTFWERAGLAVDPGKKYDDYQGDFAKKISKTKLGSFFNKLSAAGDRGFFALKVYRLGLAKSFYDNLSASQKAEVNKKGISTVAVEIAKLVNHATGTSELDLGRGNISKFVNTSFFAPKLEASRWQSLIGDPVRALNAISKGNSATQAEKAMAKRVVRNAGEKLVMYAALLGVNAGVLAATDSDDEINFTDPSKSDYLKFKVLGKTVDPTGGMQSTLRFLYSMLHPSYIGIEGGTRKEMRETPGNKMTNILATQARYKLSPVASTGIDIITQTDAMGRPLWYSQVKPRRGQSPYEFYEYLAHQQTPIPVAEYFKELTTSMEENGMGKAQIKDYINAIAVGAISGGTGIKVSESPK